MAYFLYLNQPNFPIVLLSDTQLEQLFFVVNFMPLSLASRMIVFCENDKKGPY